MMLLPLLLAPTPQAPVVATIDATKTFAPISKYVYGRFVEHIGSLVNAGIWAEMIDDRKFFNPIPGAIPAAGGGARAARTRLRPWTIVGPNDSLSMDTKNAYVGAHSPKVALEGPNVVGIEQAGSSLTAGREYTGRIVLAGAPGANVSVALAWGSGPTERVSVALPKLDSRYRKFTFRLKAAGAAANARFQILGSGTGFFEVGAVSLMPADNLDGFRREVVGVLKDLRSGVYRFPGGNFVSAHDWRNAIGDPDRRAPKFDPVWSAVQPNDVGTEEFMRLCKLIDVEPYITVNAGFGDAWSARDYVEYCNGPANSPMGRLRAANGHREPYGVKFWGIGNEMWGYSYQFGAMKLNQFLFKHNDFAEAMRGVDPKITLIGCGAMADTMTGSGESLRLGDTLIPKPLGPADWTGGLFSKCLDNMEMISEHFYNYGATHYDLKAAKQVPNDPNEPLIQWMRRPANHIRLKYEEYRAYEQLIPRLKSKPVPICLDEWAYSAGPGGGGYRVVPAYAMTFHEMFRHSDLYQMACFTFATAMYSASGGQATLTPTGRLFKLYRDHFGSIPVSVTGNSPQPAPTDPVGGEQPAVNAGGDAYPLDVVAAWTGDRKALTVAVINPTESDQNVSLRFDGAKLSGPVSLWRMAPPNLNATNVDVESSKLDAMPTRLTAPKYSVSIYVLPAR